MSNFPRFITQDLERPNEYHRSVQLRYRPHRGRPVNVTIIFSSALGDTERIYCVRAEGVVSNHWLAKKMVQIDAWVAGAPASAHKLLSCTRETNLLRVVAKESAINWEKRAAIQARKPWPPPKDEKPKPTIKERMTATIQARSGGSLGVVSPMDDLDEDLDGPEQEGDSRYMRMLRRQKRIVRMLEPAFKEKILVWNGHHKGGEYFYTEGWWDTPEKRLRSSFEDMVLINISDEDFQRMEASESGTLLDPPVVFQNKIRDLACSFCDQSLRFGFDGQRLLVVNDPCPHPNGLVTEWELNVPSGKLAIGNDFRQWFPSPEKYSVNALIGQHLTTLGYAKVGMSHGYVGGTSPSVYQDGDKFVIGSSSDRSDEDDEDDDDDDDDDVEEVSGAIEPKLSEPCPCPWGDEVASICTDLRWYSIVDQAELLRRMEHYTPGVEIDECPITVIDVRPGVYRFTHALGVDHDVPAVEFATFEWVREPGPLVDYLGKERAANLTALEVLIESCLAWPTLYMGLGYSPEDDKLAKDRPALIKRWEESARERKIVYLARAADHVMCVLGGGVEWHEKGFPRTVVSEDAKRLAKAMDMSRGGSWRGWHDTLEIDGVVPPFEGRMHWYPISAGYGGLCRGAGITNNYPDRESLNLAPSFVVLGLNICQNAIKYGEEPRLNHDVWPAAYEIPFCRERMLLFGRCYRGLREKYPELVFDAEFDRWMREVDFDQYVTNFDFGPTHPSVEKWGDLPTTIKQGDYFVFDARLLEDGHFCWHPKYRAGWAKKEDAQRYTLRILAETQSPMGHIHTHDSSCSGPATIPFRVVGRVIRGTGDGYASKILEVAFDYGTPEMCSQRWGITEGDMRAVRQFSDPQEYQALLEKCKAKFLLEETRIDALVAARD